MPGIRQKGKVPAAEWAAIAARHHAGESLTTIARDYACTAPAIRYIVKRIASRDGGAASTTRASRSAASGPGIADAPVSRQKDSPAHATLAAPTRAHARAGILDPAIRERVTGEIAAFIYALDRATMTATSAAVDELRSASDNLMRAAAKVRIELERNAK
ncbi:MAG: hypothetical protein JO010_13165 [Alphaproteobacteria bacterium]|nr:hypothetical protein [Alphaproteobacteria bacterium]